jgi:hypothetical protein
MNEKPPSAEYRSASSNPKRLPDSGFYCITVKGCLDSSWSEWFGGLAVAPDFANNQTIISGAVPDQASLHGLLVRVRDLGLTLITIARDGPSPNTPA